MIPRSLIGKFVWVRHSRVGPPTRVVLLIGIDDAGVMHGLSVLNEKYVLEHRLPQTGKGRYEVLASSRNDVQAEKLIQTLNAQIADTKAWKTTAQLHRAMDIRDHVVGLLKASVEADVRESREADDQIIKARFDKLSEPKSAWKKVVDQKPVEVDYTALEFSLFTYLLRFGLLSPDARFEREAQEIAKHGDKIKVERHPAFSGKPKFAKTFLDRIHRAAEQAGVDPARVESEVREEYKAARGSLRFNKVLADVIGSMRAMDRDQKPCEGCPYVGDCGNGARCVRRESKEAAEQTLHEAIAACHARERTCGPKTCGYTVYHLGEPVIRIEGMDEAMVAKVANEVLEKMKRDHRLRTEPQVRS